MVHSGAAHKCGPASQTQMVLLDIQTIEIVEEEMERLCADEKNHNKD